MKHVSVYIDFTFTEARPTIQELLRYLDEGLKIISATSTANGIHYILQKQH